MKAESVRDARSKRRDASLGPVSCFRDDPLFFSPTSTKSSPQTMHYQLMENHHHVLHDLLPMEDTAPCPSLIQLLLRLLRRPNLASHAEDDFPLLRGGPSELLHASLAQHGASHVKLIDGLAVPHRCSHPPGTFVPHRVALDVQAFQRSALRNPFREGLRTSGADVVAFEI
eukprot:1836067-Rhodomonas_salina.2